MNIFIGNTNDQLLTNIIKDNNVQELKNLLDNGYDINTKIYRQSMLQYVFLNFPDNIDIINLLLEYGINIEEKDDLGFTILHIVCLNNYIKSAKILLDKGANVDTSRFGETPLHTAVLNGDTQLVQLLLNYGANIENSHFGEKPLHTAILNGDIEIVQILLNYGANIEAKNANGESPLHYAALEGFYDIVKLLIEKGADIEVCDDNNYLPIDKALNPDIQELLIETQTKLNIRTRLQNACSSLDDNI